MKLIAVTDLGSGNLYSVRKALEHVAPDDRVEITSDPARLLAADRVVFPGQGAIGACISALDGTGLRAALLQLLHEGERPVLGICVGLQALFARSEEDGGTPALGVLDGEVRRFPPDLRDRGGGRPLKVPHMGWNRVRQRREHPLWAGIEDQGWFYFVHSYYADAAGGDDVAGTTGYGLEFVSAAGRGALFAVQFHPEKSQRAGLDLLANFVRWNGQP